MTPFDDISLNSSIVGNKHKLHNSEAKDIEGKLGDAHLACDEYLKELQESDIQQHLEEALAKKLFLKRKACRSIKNNTSKSE